MKTIWNLRWTDGRLIKYDGSAWATVGTNIPVGWPGNDTSGNYASAENNYTKLRQFGCFVYQGKLFARWRARDTANSNNDTNMKTTIGLFNGTEMASLTTVAGEADIEFWGNVIEYKGRIYWMARVMQAYAGTNYRNQFLLYCFYYNGGTPTLVRRRCSELGTFTQEGWDEQNWSSNNHCALLLKDCFDRIMVANPGSHANSWGSNMKIASWQASIDIASDNTITATPIACPNGSKHFYLLGPVNDDFTTTYDPGKWSGMNDHYLTSCAYKNRLWCLDPLGRVWSYNPKDGTRSLGFSHTDFAEFKMGSDATYTTNTAGDSQWQLRFSDEVKTRPFTYLGYGAKVSITNGTYSGNTYYVAGLNGNPNCISLLSPGGGARPGAMPSGTTFKIAWTFWQSGNANQTAYPQNWHHMFVYGGKLYILNMQNRRQADISSSTSDETVYWSNDAHTPPCTLVEWDGTTATVRKSFRFPSNLLGTQFSASLDEASGVLHITYREDTSKTVKHSYIDMSSFAVVDVGTIYPQDEAVYQGNLNGFYSGHTPESMTPFDTNDVTAVLTGRTLDVPNKKITVNYTLYGANADTAGVLIEYNTDPYSTSGWRTASRKGTEGEAVTGLTSSSTGTTHTFVHDLNTDFGGDFVGTIQHRISVSTQTRN